MNPAVIALGGAIREARDGNKNLVHTAPEPRLGEAFGLASTFTAMLGPGWVVLLQAGAGVVRCGIGNEADRELPRGQAEHSDGATAIYDALLEVLEALETAG